MTREWKVGDHLRVGEREGIVVEVIHNALIIDFAGERWTWILPSPALVHIKREVEPSIFPQVKVEVGGETVLDTTAKQSRTISPIVVRGYAICDPRDNSSLRVTLQTHDESDRYILVHRENTDEVMTFDADLEELKTLLEVAKKLLQKE